MHPTLEKITQQILSLNSISDEERSALMQELKFFEKRLEVDEFIIRRLKKDKSIGLNFLETTVVDLEKSQLKIKASNQQLLAQQKTLKKQKKTIKQKSQKLKENLKNLERSYHELEQFSHVASHDLKSPLRSISGFAHLLKNRYSNQMGEDADQFLDFIVSSANHMHEIIESLLKYSRVGIDQENFEEINLNNILALVQSNLSREIKENDVKIITDSLPNIKGDKISLLQLFQNLISNAIKFRSEEPPFIQVLCRKKGDYWKFQVIDNGIGLDESFQEKAFFPFQQYEVNEDSGMGLGLAICKKVVNLHDGKIYYHNNTDAGTTFSFEIPSHHFVE